MIELHEAAEEEESFFISMTDMVVGVLFIFVILLMYFAFQLRDETEEIENLDKNVNEARVEILNELKAELEKIGIEVIIEPENGILRLPENILFDRGQSTLSSNGNRSVAALAKALSFALKCHTFVEGARIDKECTEDEFMIDTIFIEGHTDSDQYVGAGYDNWDLSVKRATSTYRKLLSAAPGLGLLRNAKIDGRPIFSVSGYAETRPTTFDARDSIKPRYTDERPVKQSQVERMLRHLDNKKKNITDQVYQEERKLLKQYLNRAKAVNRRIDLRIIMKRERYGIEQIQSKIDQEMNSQ